MPEDIKEDIEEEIEDEEIEVTSKTDELKDKAEEFKAKAEARSEANKEKWDETYNKGKDVADKVGENLSKTIDDTIIALKAIHKKYDNKSQSYRETVATNKISVDLAETKDFYYLQAYLAGVAKEDISIEATDSSITINAELNNILECIDADEEDPATLIISGVKCGVAERTIKLADEITKEEISAKFDNGVLFVTIPKKEIPKTKIDIE